MRGEFGGLQTGSSNVENNDVRYDLCRLKRHARKIRYAVRQHPGIAVILREAETHLFDRDQRSSSKNSSLTHAAPQLLPISPCLADSVSRACEHRSNRRAQSF